MIYNEMIRLKRGDTVGDDTVIWVQRTEGGGVGMGEYPADVTVVFLSGRVIDANEWTHSSRVVHKRLEGPRSDGTGGGGGGSGAGGGVAGRSVRRPRRLTKGGGGA